MYEVMIGWILKMDEGAGNEHDYNDDHDLSHTAKIYEQKICNDQSPQTHWLWQ